MEHKHEICACKRIRVGHRYFKILCNLCYFRCHITLPDVIIDLIGEFAYKNKTGNENWIARCISCHYPIQTDKIRELRIPAKITLCYYAEFCVDSKICPMCGLFYHDDELFVDGGKHLCYSCCCKNWKSKGKKRWRPSLT
jgi:hypothetical protein